MSELKSFRTQFYSNYFDTQASRSVNANIEVKIANDHKHYLKEIIPHLPADKNIRILELGCGHGTLILLLKKLGYNNVVGIDVSEEQVKKAHELGAKEVQLTNLTEFLAESTTKYDVIIGLDLIEHFTKFELLDLLGSIKNSLNNNGKLLCRTPNSDAPFGSTYYFGDLTHEVFLNYSSANQLMQSCGYSNVKVLDSHIRVDGFFKELLRKLIWAHFVVVAKLALFASGKSTKNIVLTPNLLIIAQL